jgi:hypothetical protein
VAVEGAVQRDLAVEPEEAQIGADRQGAQAVGLEVEVVGVGGPVARPSDRGEEAVEAQAPARLRGQGRGAAFQRGVVEGQVGREAEGGAGAEVLGRDVEGLAADRDPLLGGQAAMTSWGR